MKASTTALRNLLATGYYVFADCYTITLNGGTIVRWTNADKPITFGGNTWTNGPALKRNAISEKTGPDVATMEVEVYALSGFDTINGSPIIPFIRNHGLDGASVKLERMYAPDWNSAITGSIIKFAGKITSVPVIQGAMAKFIVSSWMVLLDVDMPRNVYQAACHNSLYDAACTVNPASYSATGTIAAGGAGATSSFPTSLTSITANDYALGRIVFTSGANNGISRNIRSNDASGNFVLSLPLPNNLASGDAFTVYKGCDLTTGSGGCAKFNNLPNFRGQPFVPPPRTAVGSATSTTTTKSGK